MWMERQTRDACEPWTGALGRALCVAQNFERNAKHVLMSIELDRTLDRGDYSSIPEAADFVDQLLSRMLGAAISRFKELKAVPEGAIPILTAAKDARNYFAHEAAHFGLDDVTPSLAECAAFRQRATALAHGDNLAALWSYSLEDSENVAVPDLTQHYVDQTVEWIFEPFGSLR
jgi:hypothetical protein